MTMRKIGSRSLIVDGQSYRWRVRCSPTYMQAAYATALTFLVEHTDGGSVLRVLTGGPRPDNWLERPGVIVSPAAVAKAIGAVINIADLVSGNGPFASLGEEIYDDYWMYYLTKDMAQTVGVPRPYTNLKSYSEYKQRGIEILKANQQEIEKLSEDDNPTSEQEGEE